MHSPNIGPELQRLIDLLAKLPGLGPRSAKRAALHLLKKREPLMRQLAFALSDAADKVNLQKLRQLGFDRPVRDLRRRAARSGGPLRRAGCRRSVGA